MKVSSDKTKKYATVSQRLFILIISPAFFFVAYDLIFYWPWIIFGNNNDDILYLMLYLTSANILIFTFFTYKLFSKKFYVYRPDLQVQRGSISLKFTALAILSIAIILYQLDGNISFDLADVYTSHGERGAILIFLHMIIIYSLLFGLYKGGASNYVYYLTFFSILFSMLLGGRSAAIVWCIILTYILIVRLNLSIHKVFAIIAGLALLFIAASVARGTIGFEPQGLALELLDYNQLHTLVEVLNYTQISGARFDLFLMDVFDGIVPRSINPDKKTSTAFTREVFPQAWEMTSYTSGFYANLIFVFGYYAALFSPVIVALINWAYLRVIFSKRTTIKNFIIICFGICPVLMVRSGLFEQRIILIAFFILLGVILYGFIRVRWRAQF